VKGGVTLFRGAGAAACRYLESDHSTAERHPGDRHAHSTPTTSARSSASSTAPQRKSAAGLKRREPDLDIIAVQEVGLREVEDPQVLEWAAREERIVVTQCSGR
jgi:hypothetical protein